VGIPCRYRRSGSFITLDTRDTHGFGALDIHGARGVLSPDHSRLQIHGSEYLRGPAAPG
jgi:hypothetical protein